MAEQGRNSRFHENTSHQQHQELLWGLKFTVEGLLAAHTTNVWSTYGGLTRLCNQVDKVMRHRLRHPKGTHFANDGDYWDFVMGLRRLQPVLAPSVDRLQRQATEQGSDTGSLWLHTSLEAHTLASQLRLLVDDKEHLFRYYHDDAFLCSEAHFKALYVCLQSVEQNSASLLADLDPMLLQRSVPSSNSRTRHSSLVDSTADMSVPPPQRRISAKDFQPPAFASSKAESILTTSDEHAKPNLPTLKRHQSESARTMLLSLLDGSNPTRPIRHSMDDLPKTVNDPLMNMEFPTNDSATSPPQRKVLRRAKTTSDLMAPSFSAPNKEPKLLFEYASSPQDEKLENSLGSSPLESLHEEDSVKETCQCKAQATSLSESADKKSTDSEKSQSTDSLNETRCGVCGKKRQVEMSSVSKLMSKTSSSMSPPQAKSSMYIKASRPLKHSQTSLNTAEKAVKKKRPLISHSRSKSDHAIKPPVAYMAEVSAGIKSASNSLPVESIIVSPRKNSLLDSGAVSPATECYFPQPAQGQSLMSFLSSRDFERIPELDRENAHFSISEAIIAAVEQIRCKQRLSSVSDHESDASDEEIQHLKQRIRLRRNEKRRNKMRGGSGLRQLATLVNNPGSDSGMNTLTSSATTLPSTSTNSTPQDTSTESDEGSSDSTDSVEDLDLADLSHSNMQMLQTMGLSASLASLYSDADIGRVISPASPTSEFSSSVNSKTLSAESVALCLLRKFPAKQLPAASELQWLVSEQDAPQALLPMPQSLPVSPDDGENADIYTKKNTRLRGNADWAPPRAQIIFNAHPPPKRKVLVAKQNYRCAGCGMRIERGFMKRLRYCEYLGKYFCHCCHSNCSAVIPGRILQRWDFQRVPVCNFSRELLDKMHEDPLFNILGINPSLYRKVRSLNTCKELRMQLFFLKDFLKTCRMSQSLQATYESQPYHLLNEPHVYSLSDIQRVRTGDMESDLTQLVEDAVTHVSQCQLCQAKGFICEICSNDHDIIFPFQLQRTYQCQGCWACYHKTCFQTVDACPKCIRKTARKISQSSNQKESFFSDDEDAEQTSKR